MSAGIDIKFVQEMYQRMTDAELVSIATKDAYGLTPEALEIVKSEIRKRGLDENITKGVMAQNRTYSLEEIDAYWDIISNLPCPVCGSIAEKLNATMIGEVISFIFFTQYNRKIKIGCPHCLDKANEKALTKSVLLGWWGFPWGIIHTIRAIKLNLKSKKTNHSHSHNDYSRNFILTSIGELETYKENKEQLQRILTRQNSL